MFFRLLEAVFRIRILWWSDPYLWPTDLDADPGGPNHTDPDVDPEHCYISEIVQWLKVIKKSQNRKNQGFSYIFKDPDANPNLQHWSEVFDNHQVGYVCSWRRNLFPLLLLGWRDKKNAPRGYSLHVRLQAADARAPHQGNRGTHSSKAYFHLISIWVCFLLTFHVRSFDYFCIWKHFLSWTVFWIRIRKSPHSIRRGSWFVSPFSQLNRFGFCQAVQCSKLKRKIWENWTGPHF